MYKFINIYQRKLYFKRSFVKLFINMFINIFINVFLYALMSSDYSFLLSPFKKGGAYPYILRRPCIKGP